MSDNFHTPIATGANANAAVFNAPWGTIDQALTNTLDGTQAFSAFLGAIGVGAIDESALLTLISSNQGFLPPRMTTAQKAAIASPATGLVLYDTDENEPQVYDGSAWGGFSGSGVADLVPLVPATVFNGAANLALTGISQDYQDLLFRLRIRSTQAGAESIIYLRFNGNSVAGNYAWNWLYGFNLALASFNSASDTEIEIRIPASSATPGRFTDLWIWIRNYTLTQRVTGEIEGLSGNTSPFDITGAFEWRGAAAINRIDIVRSSNFAISGSYALYGLGREGIIEMLDAFSVPGEPPLSSPLVTDNTGTWVFVQTDGQFSIT